MAPPTIASLPAQARDALAQLLRRLDTTATRLSAILSTSLGVDKFLLTVYYTLKLVTPQISRLRELRLQHHLSTFLKKADSAMLPGETLITVLQLSKTDTYLAETDKSLRLLAATLSEFRMITRLWGLLTMYRWAKGTYLLPPSDSVVRTLTWGQIIACTGYQSLENVAYLSGKGILRGSWLTAERQKKLWVVSCRFWLAHTVFEGVKLLRTRQLSQEASGRGDGEKEDKIKTREEKGAWNRSWYSNAAYSPMALHYSVPDGLLSEDIVGLLGVIVGYNSFGYLWKQTA